MCYVYLSDFILDYPVAYT